MNTLKNSLKQSERKSTDLEKTVAMLKEERNKLLERLEAYKDRERSLEEQFGKFEDIDSTIKVYKSEINEYKNQI